MAKAQWGGGVMGGSVKRQVWKSVKKRNQAVYNASTLVTAVAVASNEKIFDMSPSNVKKKHFTKT